MIWKLAHFQSDADVGLSCLHQGDAEYDEYVGEEKEEYLLQRKYAEKVNSKRAVLVDRPYVSWNGESIDEAQVKERYHYAG